MPLASRFSSLDEQLDLRYWQQRFNKTSEKAASGRRIWKTPE